MYPIFRDYDPIFDGITFNDMVASKIRLFGFSHSTAIRDDLPSNAISASRYLPTVENFPFKEERLRDGDFLHPKLQTFIRE